MKELEKSGIRGAVIFSSRNEVAQVVIDEIKALGINVIEKVDDKKSAISALAATGTKLLALDWAIGGSDCVKLLESRESNEKTRDCPTFVFSPNLDMELMVICHEHGVGQVHSGEISRSEIRNSLRQILQQEARNTPLRQVMKSVLGMLSRKEYNEAEKVLLKLSKKFPTNPQITCELAECSIRSNDWIAAESLVKPLADGHPPYLRALHIYSRCMVKKKKVSEAEKVLQKARILNPYCIERLIDLGNILLHQDKIEQASSAFSDARKIDQNNVKAAIGQSQVKLVQGDVNEALSILKEMSSPQELASCFNTAAVMCAKKGKSSQALDLYDSALAAIGSDKHLRARLIYNKGVNFRRNRQINEAILCFEEAMSLDPSFTKPQDSISAISNLGSPKTTKPNLDTTFAQPSDLSEDMGLFGESISSPRSSTKQKSIDENSNSEVTNDLFSITFDDEDDDSNQETIFG